MTLFDRFDIYHTNLGWGIHAKPYGLRIFAISLSVYLSPLFLFFFVFSLPPPFLRGDTEDVGRSSGISRPCLSDELDPKSMMF